MAAIAAPMCGCSRRAAAAERRHTLTNDVSVHAPLLANDTTFVKYTNPKHKINSDEADMSEADIKAKLKYHFLNPYDKYRSRGRKPWKLVLQIAKIVVVTFQVCWFATDQFSVVNFNKDNTIVFRHIFLESYTGHYVPDIYSKGELYNYIYHVWSQYYNFTEVAIGTYTFPHEHGELRRIKFCVTKEYHGIVVNQTSPDMVYHVGDLENEHCQYLLPPSKDRSLNNFIKENGIPSDFHWVLAVKMTFELHSINLKELRYYDSPDCYKFSVLVHFDNKDEDGVMTSSLDATSEFRPCKHGMVDGDPVNRQLKTFMLIFDIIVINVCIWSAILCIRSCVRHWKLCQEVTHFFHEYRHEDFTWSDKLNFVNFWILLIIVSDTFTVCGAVMKIIIDQYYASYYDLCGLFLGVAVLLVWVGVLRYLGYLRYYNVLLVTLKVAFPTVIRFIFCVMLIYFGFAFCGWIVFGPYHYKFRNLSVTSECLFSLVNGDDMFQTFKSLKNAHTSVYIFLQLYLYSFISLFIFVVLSLFIGIISDTYERIKDYGHPPKTRIELFMDGQEYQPRRQSDKEGPDAESDNSDEGDTTTARFCPHHYTREERHNYRTISMHANGGIAMPSSSSSNTTNDLIMLNVPDSL